MKKIDLHVHSRYSVGSQNSVIKSLGSQESYVDPEEIYELALLRGMDYVTITDHDSIEGCLILKNAHPDRVIMGVESTVFFPEDDTNIHLLLYGLDEKQFENVERLRHNIYELREYLQGTDIAHSVAHATYRLGRNFSLEHIEKLLLLFDNFEARNGNRTDRTNALFEEVLRNLTPATIYNLSIKHGINPYSSTSWQKGLTAGTDDHSGLFVGMTHTLINTNSVDDAVPAIRRRKTEPAGTCRNHKAFAFEIFNGVYEEYMARGGDPRGMISQLAAHVLKEKPFSLTGKFKLRHMRKSKKVIYRMLANLVNESDKKYINADEKFDAMWTHITALTDEVIMGFFRNMTRGIGSGGPKEVLNAIPRTVASAIVYLPIIFGIKYTHKDLKFQYEVHDHFIKRPGNRNKKILWFTDTINDLNGVSVTLRNIGWLTHRRGDDVQLVASLLDREKGSHLPPNIINLESMVDFKLPYYEKLTVKVPSFFAMIDRLGKEMPDEIFISTPSVIGLYGLFFAKLFGIKCTTVYHTDFTMQAKNLIANTSPLLQLIEIYTKWFYESSDRILVPTEEYISILSKRGFDRDKMGIFYRGIDTELFSPRENAAADLRAEYGLEGGVNLLYAGRISEDKNVDFLIKAVSPLFADGFGNLNLIFVGDGPYLQTLKKRHAGNRNMVFLGEIPNHMLPTVYSGCDLLVFPSETDTFGMVVLEAQACGLPVIVSHIGGPRDILLDGTTGFVLNTENTETWTEKLKELLPLITSGDRRYTGMRERSRQHVINRYDFNAILDNFIVNDDDREKTDSDAQLRIVS